MYKTGNISALKGLNEDVVIDCLSEMFNAVKRSIESPNVVGTSSAAMVATIESPNVVGTSSAAMVATAATAAMVDEPS